jgi:mono/diheme cytochrome c family protein
MSRALMFAAAVGFAASCMPAAAADGGVETVDRGCYVALIGGCNDCHTAGFAPGGGEVPESAWLTGDALGYQGPWGTTYAPNLRRYFEALTEDQWVALAPSFRARPPMPFWVINAMTEGDLRALYRFVRSLGEVGDPAPAYAGPGEAVTTPVVLFPGPPPKP